MILKRKIKNTYKTQKDSNTLFVYSTSRNWHVDEEVVSCSCALNTVVSWQQ